MADGKTYSYGQRIRGVFSRGAGRLSICNISAVGFRVKSLIFSSCSTSHLSFPFTPFALQLPPRDPDITTQMADQFLNRLFRTDPDFVFTVTRDFVRQSQTPVLVLPDDTPGHSYDAAIESAMLAPNGQLSMYPWKDTPEKIPLAVRHVRSFLLSYRPA